MSLKNTLLGLSLLLPALLAQAQDYTVGDLHIQEVWSRAMPPVAPTAAAYFVVHNAGSQSDRLLAASTAHAARAELHEHRHAGGVMKMQQVAAIEIPAGGEARLQPMGYHVMLFELPRQAAEGEHFMLTLRFEKAGEVQIEVPVLREAPAANDHGMPHHAH